MNEKPASILKKRLVQAGFDESMDDLTSLAKEDVSFLCRFTFRTAGMKTFDVEHFENLDSYEHTDLQQRNLQAIPVFLYNHAASIVSLNLSKNPLQDLPLDFIQRCIALRELKLAQIGIKHMPSNIRQISALTRLDLSSNRILSLEHAHVEDLSHLTTLQIQVRAEVRAVYVLILNLSLRITDSQ